MFSADQRASRVHPTWRKSCDLAGRLSCALLLGFQVVMAGAQVGANHPWQRIQVPSVKEVQAHWATPPAEYGPEPYYGLNGEVTLDTVRTDLDTMRALGFRAVTVQYGFGSNRAYLSPAYFEFFRDFVAEVKKRGMRLWIVDDAGYPSGFAGGAFSLHHPELRMQALVVASRTPVPAHSLFDQAVGPDAVAVTAIRNDSAETVPLPVEGGHAHWTAPDGEWTVYVVEHGFRTSPTRSDTNVKRVKDTSQSLEDYLDPAATALFLQTTHEAYRRAVGDAFGDTILGFRGDEPDYSIAGLPWTSAFFSRFQQAKGYDIRPFLAAMLQPRGTVLSAEEQRAKADYYDVFADMFRDGFFKPQAAWCAAHGLEYQVHLNHEEQELALAHSEGDFFRDMQYVQVPGIDAIWHQIWTDTVSDYPRLASSAAHVYGHPRAFSESFAAYRPMPDVTMARYILNEQMLRGINLVEAMYFPSSSSPNGGGPMAFMRDPAFPALMHYTSRMSYVLSMGRPAAQVALLLPAEALWMGDAQADATFVTAERLLSEQQTDFDIVGEDALSRDMPLRSGAFFSLSGNRYQTVLVPDAELLPGKVVQRLREFAQGGGKVVFLGQAPSEVGTSSDLQARATTAADFAWATTVPLNLPETPTPPMQPPTSAPGPLTIPDALRAQLNRALPAPTLHLALPSPALRYTERRLKDGYVFLLFNESAEALDREVTLHVRGTRVESWDAGTTAINRVSEVSADKAHRALQVPLKLAPYEARLLVVR